MDNDAETVVARELLLLQPVVRRDPERVLGLLHRDSVEYGASGRVWDRSSILTATTEAVEPVDATQIQAHRLGVDAFLVTYRSHSGGRIALRSSTWLREDGKWLLRFHQGTVLTAIQLPRYGRPR